MDADLVQMLQLGKVGEGNKSDLRNLLARGQDLHLTQSYINLLGGSSFYSAAANVTHMADAWNPLGAGLFNWTDNAWASGWNLAFLGGNRNNYGAPNSRYSWGDVRKSTSSALSSLVSAVGGNPVAAAAVAAASGDATVANRFGEMLDNSYISGLVAQGKGYDEWVASASKFGIRDLPSAMSAAGVTETQVRGLFEQASTDEGREREKDRLNDEQAFRDEGRVFWASQIARMDTVIEAQGVTNSLLTNILEGQAHFFDSTFANWSSTWDDFYLKWIAFFIDNAYYNERTGLDYAAIRAQEHEQTEGAIYALAEAFNAGVADISDPAVQTNSLLSKILLVVSSIMQQNNARAGGSALADTLNALALGLTV